MAVGSELILTPAHFYANTVLTFSYYSVLNVSFVLCVFLFELNLLPLRTQLISSEHFFSYVVMLLCFRST
jgi:hypothetical protein